MKYEELYKPWDKQRDELINGARDPDQEELKALDEYKIPTTEKRSVNLDMEELKNTKGLPEFWFKAIKNNIEIRTHIRDHDEPILKFLKNIRVEKETPEKSKIIFQFAPNEYFTNAELVKTTITDEDNSDICKESIGTEIKWNEGKNVTVKAVKKKQKNKSKCMSDKLNRD